MATLFDYKPAEHDYRFWLVVNPSTWLIPIFIALVFIALILHVFAFSLSDGDRVWYNHKLVPVEVEAPVDVAAPAPAG